MSLSLLSVPPFEIQPSVFELRKGDSFALEVIFKAPEARSYEEHVVVTCDNCTTLEFKLLGQGQLAEIEYVPLEAESGSASGSIGGGGRSNSRLLSDTTMFVEDFKDKFSSRIVRFPTLNPNVFTRKRFAIRNKSSSCIDFSWFMFKPMLARVDDALGDDDASVETMSGVAAVSGDADPGAHVLVSLKNSGYVLDKESVFSIQPKQGTFDKNEVKTFELVFSPSKVSHITF